MTFLFEKIQMYQVIEYSDNHKENYVTLHGVTSNIKTAREKAHQILNNFYRHESSGGCHTLHFVRDIKGTNYADVTNNKEHQYCIYTIELRPDIFHLTIGDMYDLFDEDVPSDFNRKDEVTSDVFDDLMRPHLLNVKNVEIYMTWKNLIRDYAMNVITMYHMEN
jgi:hypothetical protein